MATIEDVLCVFVVFIMWMVQMQIKVHIVGQSFVEGIHGVALVSKLVKWPKELDEQWQLSNCYIELVRFSERCFKKVQILLDAVLVCVCFKLSLYEVLSDQKC